MKIILPIAGVGTRLRPFTFSKPKAFVKVAGLRVVDHIFNKIEKSLTGDEDISLIAITGYQERQIKQYFEIHYSRKFNINYITQQPVDFEGNIPIFGGLGEAIYITKDWFFEKINQMDPQKGEDNDNKKSNNGDGKYKNCTLILLGDMIPIKDYTGVFLELTSPDVDGVIGTMVVPEKKAHLYGIVEVGPDNRIFNMVEKPKEPKSNLAIAGVYAFKDRTMKRLYEILENQYEDLHKKNGSGMQKKHKEFQLTPALQQLVDEGYKLKSSVFREGILDFGHHDALIRGNKELLEARSREHSLSKTPDENIQSSYIEQPCAIGKNTIVKRSIIGPYVSIGDNCVIENCNLSNVVIGDDSELANIITNKSIIGDNVKIDSIIKDNMLIGDDSNLTSVRNNHNGFS